MTERELMFWLGAEARTAAVDYETRLQKERELPMGADLTDPQGDE